MISDIFNDNDGERNNLLFSFVHSIIWSLLILTEKKSHYSHW